jgi:rhamnosyltransferase
LTRACVFVFFDKEGVADDYVHYYLAELKKNIDRLVIVANGSLSYETRLAFEKYTGDVLVRSNEGFDAWAYKEGLEHIGYDTLAAYDEVIIANDTVFGPVYPFAQMFDEMAARADLGFWGITKHPAYEKEDLVIRNSPLGYAPAHIQTYFMVFRTPVLASEAFQNFWKNLLPIRRYEEAVGKFETYLTKTLEDAGFLWDSFVQTDVVATDDPNLLLYCPADMLRKWHCPVLKCRVFKQDTLTLNAGDQPREAFAYIQDQTDYDADLIWKSLLRKFDMCDFVKSLALTYVLPAESPLPTVEGEGKQKIALFMHIYYPEMAEEAAALAMNMPGGTDIYITTDTNEKAKQLRYIFSQFRKVREIRIVENRGRSESALLIGIGEAALKYDVACFWKEKVSRQVDYHASLAWAKKIDDSLLASQDYTENIVRTFTANPRLGLLCVPEPFHAVYHFVPGHEWAANFENTVALADKLGLHVPMDKDAQPVCSMGGAFWFRPAALKKLLTHPWKYADFPEEPLAEDGTLLHAIERVYPFTAQDAGFYPGFVMSDRYAALEYTNLRQYLSMYTYSTLYAWHNFDNYLQATDYVLAVSARPLRARVKRFAKRRLPRSLYIMMLGAKRVLLGPDRGDALREIFFRLTRKQQAKKLNG